ncbi:hypothetical protein [Nonomuraea sp. NPDC005650]|uniref:hypothetical protein n=1 Tax=Nonomuraea sp. NPDC005650 TaxID=3157045 RepID=UPI0033B83E88
MAKSNAGKSSSKRTTGKDSKRIQSAADKNPSSKSATTGFKERAQSAAAKNENKQ